MRVVSVAGLIGGVLMLGVAVLYVAILGAQEGGLTDETSPWAAALVLLGLAGIVASFLGAPRLRVIVFATSALTALVLGILSMFSIGSLLLVAALLFASAVLDANTATAAPRNR